MGIFGCDLNERALRLQLDRIERKLDLLLAERGLAVEEPPGRVDAAFLAEVRELARERKIEAIKLYRDRTGVGLREAKEVVESL